MEKGEHFKRQNRPTMQQLQYLKELEGAEKKRGIQRSIAEHCKVNSSTVNRYFKNCIERGILTEELAFTEEGKEWWQRYAELYQKLITYLKEIGGKQEEAEKTAEGMIENIDIHMLELMLSDHTNKKSVYIGKKKQHLDQEIQDNLAKCERHRVVFRMYRINRKPGENGDSMAMHGFEDMAEIVQDNGKSYLELRVKDMSATSRMNGREMKGRLSTLKYQYEGILKTVKVEKHRVKIPMEACRIHRWSGVGIMGMVPVTVTCSVGQIHMPESTALLYFWV